MTTIHSTICAAKIVEDITSILNGCSDTGTLKIAAVPDIIVKINKAIEDDTVSIFDVANVVQADTALSARILRTANSPLLCRQQSATVKDAISVLGLSVVKNLAICVLLRDQFKTSKPELNRVLHVITQDTADVTAALYAVCKVFTNLKLDVAVLIGMVHNIGKYVLLSHINDVCSTADVEGMEVEPILSQLNTQVSRFVLAKWGFPTSICDAVFVPPANLDLDNIRSYKQAFAVAMAYVDGTLDEQSLHRIEDALKLYKRDIHDLLHPFS